MKENFTNFKQKLPAYSKGTCGFDKITIVPNLNKKMIQPQSTNNNLNEYFEDLFILSKQFYCFL